jgi:hypothetical protein
MGPREFRSKCAPADSTNRTLFRSARSEDCLKPGSVPLGLAGPN